MFVTLKVVLYSKKNVRFNNISNQQNFFKNRFINECANKDLAKRALCDLP